MKVFATLIAVCLSAAAIAQDVPKLRLEKLLRGFENPVFIGDDGKTDRLFVIEQRGKIRIVKNGELQPKPFLDIRKEVDFGGEKGLLGLAFHPDFEKNGLFYVDFTADRPKLQTVIAEFHVDPNSEAVDPASERVLLTIDQPYPNHNGGGIMFGPDKMLYITMGDGGNHDDPFNNGQNKDSLLGKILRIDVNQKEGYAIPQDNPFVGKSGRPEIWAWGMRNAWRFSFDRKTGDLWAGDVGQNNWEEVDLIVKGGNYGWRSREGFHPTPSLRNPGEPTPDGAIDPIVEYPHRKGEVKDPDLSITGGFVYRGSKYPSLVGWYLYADYVSGRIWGLKYENGKMLQNTLLLKQDVNPSSFGQDKDGELYLCEYGRGIIWKIEAE